MDKFNRIFEMQAELQRQKMGGHPGEFAQDAKIQFIKDMTLALEDELHEALGEVGWKPWATSQRINRAAYLGELVDALHFFINLCLVVNATPYEIYEMYVTKNLKNHKRQEEGYDGVSSKCPGCKRDLDDSATSCIKQTRAAHPGIWVWCAEAGDCYPLDKEAHASL